MPDQPGEASHSAETTHSAETARSARRRWALFLGLAGGVVIVDQATKAWVDASFALASASRANGDPSAPTPIVGDLVRIAKTYNDGGIFGLFDATAPLLGIIGVLVIAGITWYEWRHGAAMSPMVTAGLGLLLGGALGNLIDRARFGHVIDFVDAGLGSIRWYAFNVADAAISVGLLLLLVVALAGERLGRRRGVESAAAADGPS